MMSPKRSKTRRWMSRVSCVIWVCVAVLFLPVAFADQWVTPQPSEVTSPGGDCKALIEPGDAQKGKKPATLTRSGACGEASFALLSEWMPVDVVLFDDGSLVAFDQWHSLGYDAVAIHYAPDGSVRWSKTLVDLLGQETVDRAPHSVSSIWWRKTPLEYTREPKALLVTLWNEDQLRVFLADGAAEIVAVTDLGTDPERLMTRAEALSREGRWAEAIPLLEEAIKHTPKLRPHHMLGDALREGGQPERAVSVMKAALAAFDAGTIKGSWEGGEANELANFLVSLAKAQEQIKDDAAALESLQRAIKTYPGYMYTTQMAAEILQRTRKIAERDALLAQHLANAAASGQEYLLSSAAADVGDFYRRINEPQKALDAYLKGYKADAVTSQFLYLSLAELYESEGKKEEAVKVYTQLIAYFKTMPAGAFDYYIQRCEEALKRLK